MDLIKFSLNSLYLLIVIESTFFLDIPLFSLGGLAYVVAWMPLLILFNSAYNYEREGL